MNESLKAYTYIILMVVMLGGIGFWKGCAPQSGCRSRVTGKAVQLECPDDCKRVVSMGRSTRSKWVCYETYKGTYKLREFSDYGVFEAEYEMEAPPAKEEGEKDE
jgi:hypothetical protein